MPSPAGSGSSSRQHSPGVSSGNVDPAVFNNQSFFPTYNPERTSPYMQHQQLPQNNGQFGVNLSPTSQLPNDFSQQLSMGGNGMDLGQGNNNNNNNGFTDFPLYDSGSPNQLVNPNNLYNTQPNDTMNPQDLMNSNGSMNTLLQPHNQSIDWTGTSFQNPRGHQRALSDVSDASPALSPFVNNHEFEGQPSPLLVADQPGEMTAFLQSSDNFGLDSFSLNDNPNGFSSSPRHSPHITPHLTPQHTGNSAQAIQRSPYLMPTFQFPAQTVPSNSNMLGLGLQDNFGGFNDQSMFEPPSIEVEFAPPQRQPTFPGKLNDADALSPPPRSKAQRQRSKSDPPLLMVQRPSRPNSPQPPQPLHSQSYGGDSSNHERRTSLHPDDVLASNFGSELQQGLTGSSSSSAVNKHARRSSTSAIPNRDYILDLAAPTRPGALPTDTKRVQKHPATFQCSLCPKRFTRAYNLRSHLRTHTDERPFVCTVCGKAFARQHDRKRHEGLHSGEKKFVCRGDLKGGGHWGCGRRFARADALGRHFRSEAGRICIKPLLDEESQERLRLQQESNINVGMATVPSNAPYDLSMSYQLPLALLQQYPALAGAWESLGAGGGSGMDDDDDRRGGFDVSSGGEDYYDDVSSGIGSHRNSYDGSGYGSDVGWASDSGVGGGSGGNEWMKQESSDWKMPVGNGQ